MAQAGGRDPAKLDDALAAAARDRSRGSWGEAVARARPRPRHRPDRRRDLRPDRDPLHAAAGDRTARGRRGRRRWSREREVERVVVGLPVHLSGEEGSQAALARTFAEELEALLDVPVDTYDERLTSRMADASRRAGAGAARDSLAAAHLLEAYLMSLARKGEA